VSAQTDEGLTLLRQDFLPHVNLLPPEIAARVRFRKVQCGLGMAVVAAVAAVGLLVVSAGSSVADAEEQVQAAGTEQTRLQAEARPFAEVGAVYARAAAAEQMLVQAMGQEVRYSRFLNDLSLTVPPEVWITNASFAQDGGTAAAAAGPAVAGTTSTPAGLGTITLTGIAFDHDDVALWLEVLAKQRGFAAPFLQSSTEALLGTKKTVNWTTSIVLSPDALSNAYPAAGG